MSWRNTLAVGLGLLPFGVAAACSAGAQSGGAGGESSGSTATTTTTSASAGGGGASAVANTSTGAGGIMIDAGNDGRGGSIDPDAACATASEKAQVTYSPVDIIWMVDNSTSMQPSIDQVTAGLNNFAALIASKSLDYRVIMLSLKSKTNPTTANGSARYGVCIPAPLAGDDNCGDGPRFFQSSVDMKSTQPLEEFLGTLGQTPGFQPGDERGGDPWKQDLRPDATKTLVVVTDDNSRLTADDFQHFAGGTDPFNTTTLPPGILDASWSGLFDKFVFSGIYGWGTSSDPSIPCSYGDGTMAAASGETYSDLVTATGGVRASICDGATAWGPFFDQIAQAVQTTAKLTCNLAIPTPQTGMLDPMKLNVDIVSGTDTVTLGKVGGASDCQATGGWYYDDDANPKNVILCPSSCDVAQQLLGGSGSAEIQVLFGCATIVK